jgi:hypothetical protein
MVSVVYQVVGPEGVVYRTVDENSASTVCYVVSYDGAKGRQKIEYSVAIVFDVQVSDGDVMLINYMNPITGNFRVPLGSSVEDSLKSETCSVKHHVVSPNQYATGLVSENVINKGVNVA